MNESENFHINKNQISKLNKWKKKHKKIYTENIAGRYTYSFTHTGIGQVCVVKDNVIDESIDITDYDSW